MVAIAPISLIRVRELTASIDPHKSINPNTTTNNLLGKTQELGHGLLHTSQTDRVTWREKWEMGEGTETGMGK